MLTFIQAREIQSGLGYYGAYIYYNPTKNIIKCEILSTEFENFPSFKTYGSDIFVKLGRIRNHEHNLKLNNDILKTFLEYQQEKINNFNLLCN